MIRLEEVFCCPRMAEKIWRIKIWIMSRRLITIIRISKGQGVHYVCGTVAKNSTVEIVSLEGDWYKIVFRNGYGYVSKDYIQVIN